MSLFDHSSALRVQLLLEQGYLSTHQQRPAQDDRVDYDLLFMGQRVFGHRTLSVMTLEADQAINPIDAALLLGSGPGISSVFWRPHDPIHALQGSSTAWESDWD